MRMAKEDPRDEYSHYSNAWAMLSAKSDDDIFLGLLENIFREEGLIYGFKADMQGSFNQILRNYRENAIFDGMTYADVVGLLKRKYSRAAKAVATW